MVTDDGDDCEDDMKWPTQVAAMRLLKKVKKEHMIPMLDDFGLKGVKGSKDDMASKLLAEQLHYETDEDA